MPDRAAPPRVAVVGAGSWGTTVAALAAVNAPTVLWARRPELAAAIERERTNGDYLPGVRLPDELRTTASLDEAIGDAELVVMAVPSHGYRAVAAAAAPHVGAGVPVVSLAKGIEAESLKRMTEVTLDEMPGRAVAVLTGPNLAREILAGQPAASVVAADDPTVASGLQRVFGGRTMRIYTNADVVGCELGGATKNVIAIAAGMATGMGFGDNTRASLVTRGLAEMTRLGLAMGAKVSTFAGLAGIGDLIATCASPQSRNATVGAELGRGRRIDDIVGSMTMVAEGVKSSSSVLALARRYGVEMPITEQVVAVCHHGRTAVDALEALLEREHTREFDH
jgi:glycerol-3-phosphate dehydrogenase (NAD(P)+)